MPDQLPSGGMAIYVFLEMVALAFVFGAVEALVSEKPWYIWVGCLVLGLLFFLAGIKWGTRIGFVVVGVLANLVILFGIYRYLHKNPSLTTVAPPVSSAPVKQNDEKPPTLLDLFARDLNLLKITNDAILKFKDGTAVPIKVQMYLDFNGKTKFIGFYVPFSGESTTSYKVCRDLVGHVKPMLEKLSKQVSMTAGYRDQGESIQDLIFSGRVFLYYEDNLTISEKAEIIKTYKAKHFDVQFRGPDYLDDQAITWHRQHDEKAAH